jgi:hypothetical protein
MQPDEILERMSASENNRCLEKETGVVRGCLIIGGRPPKVENCNDDFGGKFRGELIQLLANQGGTE